MPRYDLKTPCLNCPFRSDDTRIRFRCRERAEEIEEHAYRHGFPCHLSATLIEDDEYDSGGYVFGEQTQYCAGHIILMLHDYPSSPWPGIHNDAELMESFYDRMNMDAPVFRSVEDFLNANEEEEPRT